MSWTSGARMHAMQCNANRLKILNCELTLLKKRRALLRDPIQKGLQPGVYRWVFKMGARQFVGLGVFFGLTYLGLRQLVARQLIERQLVARQLWHGSRHWLNFGASFSTIHLKKSRYCEILSET
mgnify:CR=1 FL=1